MEYTSNKEKFETLLNAMISIAFNFKTLTSNQFNDFAATVRAKHYDFLPISDQEFEEVKRNIQEYRATENTNGTILVDQETIHDPWYTTNKSDFPTDYVSRFIKYLSIEKKWSDQVILKLDENTDKIMDYIGNPLIKTEWSKKGLLIGDIQSGKTSNYTFLCNKAVDAGYKIIIVLAGMTNSLRKQTQQRLEKDFVGITKITPQNSIRGEITPSSKVGVANYGSVSERVETFTSDERDFSKTIAETTNVSFSDKTCPKLFVVKKVKSVLNNLYYWLKNSIDSNNNSKIDIPMILIDDESDNASVNTGDEYNPSSINNSIRSILKLFSRQTYLGVTATPFANIFINPYNGIDNKFDPDLFPKDFIYSLPSPTTYFGSSIIFASDSTYSDSVITELNDHEMVGFFEYGHKKDVDFNTIPSSLREALQYFILTIAIRNYRGQTGSHRSMLINVSRFVDVQNRLRDLIIYTFYKTLLADVVNFSKLSYEEAMKNSSISQLYEVWTKHNLSVVSKCSWEVLLRDYLLTATQDIKIISINQKSIERLDYENSAVPLKVIVIGGDCLSRGITLEDLSVSYFYRNSQAYDTLMQMGRWFGYRPGYSDLVKIWISKEATAWYRHISETIEELKVDIIKMNRNNMTPLDFGLKIKGHPDSLIPTARNKMRNATLNSRYVEVDIAGKLIESPRLINNESILNNNENLVCQFINQLDFIGQKDDNELIWRNIEAGHISSLVRDFKSLLWHWYFDSTTISDYILECDNKWDVSIQTGSSTNQIKFNTGNAVINFPMEIRKVEVDKSKISISGTKVRVGKGECAKTGLSESEISRIKENYRKLNFGKNYPDGIFLCTKRNSILFIHFVLPNNTPSSDTLFFPQKVVALGLGFAKESEFNVVKEKKLKYYLNKIGAEIDLETEFGDDFVVE